MERALLPKAHRRVIAQRTQQMKTARGLLALTAGILAFAWSHAYANVVYTFAANGVTESYAQQGTAVFNFSNDGSALSITLTDTVNPTAAILSEISGLQFILSSAPSAITLTSVSATAIIDCTNSASPCPPGDGASPYGWGTASSGNETLLAAGFDGNAFAFEPYAIVNANYISAGGAGGLGTPSNNPLLVGPVTFNFALTGLQFAPEVSGVVFAFGDPVFLDGPAAVPEPGSLALVAIALLALACGSRYRKGAKRS